MSAELSVGSGEPRGRIANRKRPGKSTAIVRVKFDENIWHRWLAEHNERMRNPAVALREKQ